MDRWRDIPSEPGYQVTSDGRVRSVTRVVRTTNNQRRTYRGRELRPGRTASGHLTVACGRGNSRSVHVLVLEAFVGPRPEGMEGLHGNGKSEDNRLKNLRWGTRSENLIDNVKHGKALLTEEQVIGIRRRYVPHCKDDGAIAIAKELGVETYIVHSCLSGKNYAWI